MPDLAAQEAALEEAFARALDFPDSNAALYFQQWGTVMTQAIMLDHQRTMATGGTPEPDAAQRSAERILQRWQEARPDSPNPDLMRTFQLQDPEAQREAVLALHAKHPDSYLVTVQAADQLRRAGEDEKSTELLEAFLANHPDRTEIYGQLVGQARENPTRQATVLERWARAAPGDPNLVSAWLASSLPAQDPAATAEVLDDFFARKPTGGDFLRACQSVLRTRGTEAYRRSAHGCIARLIADPVPWVAEEATRQMASLAAEAGDRAGLAEALGGLDGRARWTALLAAAQALPVPERCAERLELLQSALQAADSSVVEPGRIAAALQGCERQAGSQDLYTALLRTSSAEQAAAMVQAWVRRSGGGDSVRITGEVPPGTTALLERRLAQQPDEAKLYEALDLLYQLDDPEGKRPDLLLQWYERAPSNFSDHRLLDLAHVLVERGKTEAAMEILAEPKSGFWSQEVAEMLWSLHLQQEGPEAAERFARELLDSDEAWRVPVGHLLAARTALLRQDRERAEEHYRQVLQNERHLGTDVAVEMLEVLGPEDPESIAALALDLCGEPALALGRPDAVECAADILVRAGRHDAATEALTQSGTELPEDLEALRKLGRTAAAGGDPALAERALRRVLEVDPRNSRSWTDLGVFLEEQGRVDELVDLLEPSRRALGVVDTGLHRTAARTLTASGRPGEAIDVLLEARAALPQESAGDWSRSWIDHELQEAYRLLASQSVQSARDTVREVPPSPTTRFGPPPQLPDASAAKLRTTADALYSGSGGRYDPVAAAILYQRAAELGDPLATFRLAVLMRLSPDVVPAGLGAAETLYRRSAKAVHELAERGDSTARYLLGTAALSGPGPTDYATARRWLEQAAEQGESWAWHNLGWAAETGRGRPVDRSAAREAYRKGAEAGNCSSMLNLAGLLLAEPRSREECSEALSWLEKSAVAGHARAAHQLGKSLLYGRPGCLDPSPGDAVPWLEAARRAGQPGADFDLGAAGMQALIGKEATSAEVRRRSLELLQESASRQEPLALEVLALLHVSGLGVERDLEAVGRYLGQAASLGSDGFGTLARQMASNDVFDPLVEEAVVRLTALAEASRGADGEKQVAGDPAAAAYLARLQTLGLAGPVEPRRTVALARQGAGGGEPLAMHVLSLAYREGDGVEKDLQAALRWLDACARTGDSFCLLFQARKLLEGEEVPRDVQAGFAMLQRAADAGNLYAIQDLARLLAHGAPGIPADPDAAEPLMGYLAQRGDPEARGWLAYQAGR